MGLGLLELTNVGKENVYLTTQPEITYFKVAYKKYTNFSIEETPQYFKTTPDFGRRCVVNIGKNADLMGMSYLYVQLPSVQYENLITSVPNNFAWVEKIGMAIINFVEIELGGNIIDRHYGDWLNIWNELTIGSGIKKAYNKMIGNITTLTDYSASKLSYILYIPLSFWFCLDSGLALPLVALSHNDIKIHVEFNDISLCYNLSPSYYISVTNNICLLKPGETFYQFYQNTQNIGEFVYFDKINQRIYYNPIKGKFVIPTIDNNLNLVLTSLNTNFQIYIQTNSVVVQNNNYFKYNTPSIIESYLVVNYIYLDNSERIKFINKSHEYLIPTVQTIPAQTIFSINAIYKLPLYNSVKLIIWRCLLLSNITLNKQFKYMQTVRSQVKPDNLARGSSILEIQPQFNNEESLINKNFLVLNSINCIDINSIQYYTTIQNYQCEFNNNQSGIFLYSFALNPKDIQPSGSLNFSKINDAYIQLNMNPIVNYQNPISIQGYAVQYNLLKVLNGIGGLIFK